MCTVCSNLIKNSVEVAGNNENGVVKGYKWDYETAIELLIEDNKPIENKPS